MAITVAAAKAAITTSLGGAPEVLDTVTVLNAAGRELVQSHPWNWLRRPAADLGVTADQAYTDLPSDFGRLVSLTGTTADQVTLVSPDEWSKFERDILDASETVACFFEYSDGDGPTTPRIYWNPTPSTTDADAYRITYLAGWAEKTADNDNLVLPVFLETLYWEFLFAVARGWDEQDVAGLQPRLAPVKAGPTFMAAVEQDTESNPVMGPILNGGARRRGVRRIEYEVP
ncbi:MAG: hypothetical protein RIB60_06100 [Phycisphaerales bacterium]